MPKESKMNPNAYTILSEKLYVVQYLYDVEELTS